MARNDSENVRLIHTNDSRASLADMNAVRPSNYLNSYLERVTDTVKVSKYQVTALQEQSDFMEQSFDGMSSMRKGSVVFRSKKGSLDVFKSGTTKAGSKQGFFPKLQQP